MSISQKILVIGLFLLGLVAPISGFCRLATLMEYSKGTDTTYLEIPPGQWTILEAQIDITCASIPALKGLFLHFTGKYKGSQLTSHKRMLTNSNTTSQYPKDSQSREGKKFLGRIPGLPFRKNSKRANVNGSRKISAGSRVNDIEMQRIPVELPGKTATALGPREQVKQNERSQSSHESFSWFKI